MDLKKLPEALCRIHSMIRRLLGLPDRQQPSQKREIQSDNMPPDEKSRMEEYEDNNEPAPDAVPVTDVNPADDDIINVTPSVPKPPIEIPGTRGKKKSNGPRGKNISPESQPELICKEVRSDNQWEILIVLPQDQTAKLLQGESELLPNNNSSEYVLSKLTEEVTVEWTENSKHEIIKLFDEKRPLIFQVRKNWKGTGRQVKHVSNGCYMVFAPYKWTRKGDAPIDLSNCSDDTFSAHYFSYDSNRIPDGFDECSSFFLQKRFSLDGKILEDDSDMGGLFVGEELKLVDIERWQDILWVRVGEEGEGKKWGENFNPDETNLKDVLENRNGWFYIRVYYDGKMTEGLADSFDFRRLTELENILVNDKPYSSMSIIAPASDGHTKATIRFSGKIKVKSGNSHSFVDSNNTAVVAPNPDADKTQWILIGDNGQATVNVHLPRIWWCWKDTDDEKRKWQDTAFEMSRDKFRSNKSTRIIIRLPVIVSEIKVGFDAFSQYEGARRYRARRNNGDGTMLAEFELRDFCDHREISEHSLTGTALRVQCGGTDFSIINIIADVPLDEPIPVYPLLQILRPATKNKRFSHAELDVVGLIPAEIKYHRISIDCRRKSKYSANIEKLNNLR